MVLFKYYFVYTFFLKTNLMYVNVAIIVLKITHTILSLILFHIHILNEKVLV